MGWAFLWDWSFGIGKWHGKRHHGYDLAMEWDTGYAHGFQ